MGRFVVGLGSGRSTRESVAGGKGASLARLRRAGFRVPPGFVITTTVFRGALTAAVRRLVSEAGPPDVENLEAIRRSFLSWDILPAHRRAILRAYRRLGGPVAVRSSMVGEDSEKASFAGQLDTVLDVTGDEEVLAAVRKCLASAFGSRLWAYVYEKNGASTGNLAMAVVVQTMVRASVSGVAFSVDPMTCEPCVVIEAVPGLGEPLVQGRSTPDRYRAGYQGDLTVSFVSGPSLLGGEEVRELAATVRAIEARYGLPQDVEWALDPAGFHILQARPITTLPERRVYSSRLVSDMAPGLVKPLVWSMVSQSIVRSVLAPLIDEVLGASDIDYSGLIAKFHSRVYADRSMFEELAAQAGLPSSAFDAFAGEETAADPSRPDRFGIRVLPFVSRALPYALRQLAVERRARHFLDARRRDLAAYRTVDWAAAGESALLGHLDRLTELHGQSLWHVVHLSTNILVRTRLLSRMLAKWAPAAKPGDVLKGYGKRGPLLPYEGISRLASEAREVDARVLARLAGGDGADIRAELGATPEGRALLGQFDVFMSRYGFLSANGSDFSEVPWVENPRLVWQTVARIALAHPSTLWDGDESRRQDALGRLRSGLGPLRNFLFGRLHDARARLQGWRERVSLFMTEESYLMRRAALALGARLAARDVIGRADDIFYLYADELKRILADPREASRAWGLVNARKAELLADAAVDAPETIYGDASPEREAPAPAPEAGPAPVYLPGIGTSNGISTGRARIVRDPFLVAERLEPTDILVVPFTDVGWTPLLSGIGGIVAEKGGQLSHASIIARECAIPAVVSVRKATVLIREGQLITVDGTAGRVYFHPGEGA